MRDRRWPGDRHRPPERRLIPQTTADWLGDARRGFRIWRRTRPFWGGLLVIVSACELLTAEHGPIDLVIHIGVQGMAGYLVPLMLLLCGILLWFSPAQRAFYSLLSIVLALGSWLTSDLGGFFIGMLLGVVGGALAFAWSTGSERRSLEWSREEPRILASTYPLEVLFRPPAALPAGRTEITSGEHVTGTDSVSPPGQIGEPADEGATRQPVVDPEPSQ